MRGFVTLAGLRDDGMQDLNPGRLSASGPLDCTLYDLNGDAEHDTLQCGRTYKLS